MGQVLQTDNIPTLVVGGTSSVTLAATNLGLPTLVTIGGQQYIPSATMTLTTSGTGANGLDTGTLGAIQLWYVYAIVNNSTFVPALVASQTAPSSGPTMPSGYGTAYKLVGAFYTNSSSQVASTVTTSGPAMTGPVAYTPTFIGLGTVTAPNIFWSRQANRLKMWGNFTAGTPTNTLAQITLPFSADSTTLTQHNNEIGYLVQQTSTSQPVFASGIAEALIINTLDNTKFGIDQTTNTIASGQLISGANGSSLINTNAVVYIQLDVAVSGWNNTLL